MTRTPRKPKEIFVIVIVLQGKPMIITDYDDPLATPEPHIFTSLGDARDFTCQPHIGIRGAESIVILNCNTGETETL
jgi:hypothetical protein